jgi:catechol 2,3-dioxygenase-like lactoylglutathione lyase family enzyme
MDVTQIDHVNIRIPDTEEAVETAVQFYRDVLGFEPAKLDRYRAGERTSFAFRMGETAMLHVRPVNDFKEPTQANYDHFCLVLDGGIDEIKQLLAENDVPIRRESEPWGAAGRAPAVYVADPFGYVIELKAGK